MPSWVPMLSMEEDLEILDRARAVAMCITVSSEYFQARVIFRCRGPLPFVIWSICLWIIYPLVVNYQVPL